TNDLLDGTEEETLSTREALERAVAWAAEGMRLYDEGEHATARDKLHDARIMLLEADLPETIQEQGLSFLNCALPAELHHYDLEAIAQDLDLEFQTPAGESALAERRYIEREVRRILRRFGAGTPDEEYLRVFVDEVEAYINYYRGSHREFFERAFERKHKYWPTIEAVFSARHIPIELGYMALVESGFNPRAYSRARARGIWQFISSTGRRYQLRRTDDFYDVVKATEAASEYLLDLIGIFGSPSFLLATAAYNAGEGRIQGCLRELDDPFEKRSFWEIRGCLARETREYVPRIMAAAVIGTDPARFGFDLPTEDEVRQRYDVVTIPSVTRLSQIARHAGVSVAQIRTANTDLAPTATATPVRNFPIYLPVGAGERLAAALSATPPGTRVAAAEPRQEPARPADTGAATAAGESSGAPFEYVVQAGDTLSEIAQSFQVRVADLKQWNPSVGHRTLYRGDRLTIYPPSGRVERVVVRVRPGDTLSEIAERHGVRYQEVASWNQLERPYRLRVDQRLVIYPRGSAPARIVYTVQRGNNLRAIANIFSVRYRDIMQWNALRSSTLRVGQKLEIHPPKAFDVESYKVRRGDTVARIARRFGVAVRDVLTANGLGKRTLIRPGQRLIVYTS
ncbi:MAG: LysM peptidoglycan-binding domain-containing protein, partial [bacterium]|nr:LysM peptidoglycan-binding domain-containing protein [bacterium]